MKIKYFIALLSMAMPFLLQAVPASPRVMTVKNPDGTEVRIRMHGDEFFHFMTDEDGSRILERDHRGFISNAVRNGKLLTFDSGNVDLLRREAYASDPVLAATFAPTRSGALQKMAALDSEGRTSYPTIGIGNRSLVVLVEFQDVKFSMENPKDYYTRMLNEPGFSEYGAYGSALDYYKTASNGLYSPKFDVFGPVKVSKDASFFKDRNSGQMAVFVSEALKAVSDKEEIDFSEYDLDNDGTVDTVFFFYAGYGQADSDTETIWPHQSDYKHLVNYYDVEMLKFDGKTIGPYACGNELAGYNPATNKNPWKDGSEPWVDGIGTFVHEYGHVLGLPDLYDVDKANTSDVVTPGEWDVMDVGSYNFNGTRPPLFSAYEQWVCRWLEFTDAEDGNRYELNALGQSDAPSAARIRIQKSKDSGAFEPEFFVIEARDNSGWDACFPKGGLMVWRINYNRNIWFNNSVNTKDGSNVEIVYANGKKNPVFSSGAIYPGGKVELVPSKKYDFWESPVIAGIGYNDVNKVGCFHFNAEVEDGVATVLHSNPLAAADGSNSFKLKWDPVDGVDGYQVTVRTAASKRIVSEFDNKNVGNVTTVVVGNISNVYWKLEMEAFVTCVVNGLPSSSTSNVITFKPTELTREDENAVGSLEGDDVEIKGGQGCVIAPDGATVFDMAGRCVGSRNLAAGVYLVKYGMKSQKVVVK